MQSPKFLLGLFALPLMACATASAGEHDHAGSTIKPGADIQISAVQVGDAQPGQPAEIKLSVSEAQKSGSMKIEMVGLSGLALVGTPGVMTVDMADGDIHDMAVTVSAPAAGRYYANVKVTQQGLFGPQSQVYAVPVQIGPRPQAAPVNENGRVVFEADEEIR